MPISEILRWGQNQKSFSRKSHGFQCKCLLFENGNGSKRYIHTQRLVSVLCRIKRQPGEAKAEAFIPPSMSRRPFTNQRFLWTLIERKLRSLLLPPLLLGQTLTTRSSVTFRENQKPEKIQIFPRKIPKEGKF